MFWFWDVFLGEFSMFAAYSKLIRVDVSPQSRRTGIHDAIAFLVDLRRPQKFDRDMWIYTTPVLL